MMGKRLLILMCCVIVVFANSLFNEFVGDDFVLIEENEFFYSWANVRHLFSPVYNTDPDAVFNQNNFSSGSVAYRPILSLTYFWDYFLWQKKPFGYHLQNVFWHMINACLIFLIVWYCGLGFLRRLSLWPALIFAVHPLCVEAVCSIGYRADLLAASFVLAAFFFYLFSKRANKRKEQLFYYAASLGCYGLGLFSKESAVIFPLLVVLYESAISLNMRTIRGIIFSKVMAGYSLLLAFYLGVYFFVFPNLAIKHISDIHGGILLRGYSFFAILGYYVKGFFLPWTVKNFPPVFQQDFVSVLNRMDIIWISVPVILAVWFWRRGYKGRRAVLFGLGWFVLAYLPVSNIIPMITPLAHRYVYLPSIGLSIALAAVLLTLNNFLIEKGLAKGKFLSGIFVVFCAALTVSLNTVWKNNFVMARHMVKDFPENPRGYFFTGLYFADKSERQEALSYLQKAADLGLRDSRLFLTLGETLALLGRKEEAREWFRKGIEQYPQLYKNYASWGGLLLSDHEYDRAVVLLESALRLRPTYAVAGYLIQAYRLLGQDEYADKVYEQVRPLLKTDEQRQVLADLLEEDIEAFPRCLGVSLGGS